ncbi:MAG: HAD-IC family P-type ATPase [Rubellimicrobium sp.]|nr:HAD-IC family P-type ATPase [Rubellimicrobium sp.]
MAEVPTGWWAQPAADLLGLMQSGPDGLTAPEAAARLGRHGANRLTARQGPTGPRLLLRQFESPLVLILVLAALVALLAGEWTEAGIILAIIAGSTVLGFSQELRASQAMRALQARLALRASVLRDGTGTDIPVEGVVPGDIVLLDAGDLVPADGVVIEARDCLVSQAALTGESFPVEKRATPSPAGAPVAGRWNALFLGCSVRSGTARMLVIRTGPATAFGAIAARLAGRDPETDFERGIRGFGVMLTRIMTVIVTLVLAANLLLDRPVIDSLLFSVALAVGLTPELLPAIVSVTMAAGARRMAREGVIVRRLAAVENLGTADILCTDKTGTLTSGQVELSGATDPDGTPSAAVLDLARINAGLQTGIANPLDAAILLAADRHGAGAPLPARIDEIPYDFTRKRLSVVVDAGDGSHLIVTKGAFDPVLACCTHLAGPAGPVPLDDAARARLGAIVARHGAEGVRALGLCTRRTDPGRRYGHEDESGMTFAGFLLFSDPLKPGIAATIAALAGLGIAVKIVSGDNPHVALHVARAIGLEPA